MTKEEIQTLAHLRMHLNQSKGNEEEVFVLDKAITTLQLQMCSNRLRSCPFCTGQGVVRRALKNNKYYVRCQRCGAETRHDFVTEEDAINAWNHRRES